VTKQGKGLFATQDYAEGEVIFAEQPLVCAQFAWNAAYRYLACDHCMRSMETAEQMSRRLTGNTSFTLPHSECCNVRPFEHVFCHHCAVSYAHCTVYVFSINIILTYWFIMCLLECRWLGTVFLWRFFWSFM